MSRLIKPTNHRLNLISQDVDIHDLSSLQIQNLLGDMRRIAAGKRANKDQPNKQSLAGLAAPQLGKLVRIILVDMDAIPTGPNFSPNLKFFINPRIIKASVKENLWKEGCFSTGEITGAVYRSNRVTVVAFDENGKEFIHNSDNPFQARILQHEIDHLDGIRFPSRVRNPKQLHLVNKNDRKDYKENWANWPKLCPFEEWLEIYNNRPSKA